MSLCLELSVVEILLCCGVLPGIGLKVCTLSILTGYNCFVSIGLAIYSNFYESAIFFSLYFAITAACLLYTCIRFPERRKLLLIPLYLGEFHFEYANFGIGSDNVSATRVAILNDFSVRFTGYSPIRRDNYITCGFINGEQFYCTACSSFFDKKDKVELLEFTLQAFYVILLLFLPFLWKFPALFSTLALFLYCVFYLYRYIPRFGAIGIIIQILYGVVGITAAILFITCLIKGWDLDQLLYLFGGLKCFVHNVMA